MLREDINIKEFKNGNISITLICKVSSIKEAENIIRGF